MSIAVQIATAVQPMGPANILSHLVKAALAATESPLPSKALHIAFATITASL